VKPATLPSIARIARRCADSGEPARFDLARAGWTALLLAMLLFSQWMGMQHRIAHAGWINGQPSAMQFAAVDVSDTGADAGEFANGGHEGRKQHSCSLVDGTALADTLTSFLFLPPPADCAKVLALWLAYQSWDAPLNSFFLSRAPPAIG
jgi:hypothetical protein